MSDDTDNQTFRFVSELGRTLAEGKLELPSFPDIALRIRRVLDKPDSSAEQLVRVINSEPVLAARLLRLVNSALMHRGGGQVTDLHAAVLRLGQNMVRNVAVSLAVEQLFRTGPNKKLAAELHRIWQHSIRVAAISYVLAAKFTRLNADEAFLAGLLHDIGELYILVRADDYPELFGEPAALKALIDQWHTGVGRAILEAWEMPDEIVLACDEHEVLDREHLGPPDLADVVLVANLHAKLQRRDSDDPGPDWEGIAAFKRLKLTPEMSVDVLRESSKEIASMAEALSGV